MPEQLPLANVFAVIMQAPTDLMSLTTRQITETFDVLGVGMEKLGAQLAAPPEMAALPMLPPLPGMAPAGAPTGAAPPGAAPQGAAPRGIGIQSRSIMRGGRRPKIIV